MTRALHHLAIVLIATLGLVPGLSSAGPAAIDVPAVRQWFLEMLKVAPQNFRGVSGEQLRVENRARGAVARYHVLLKVPPGFQQDVQKAADGAKYATGNVVMVKAAGGEFAMASYTFTAADVNQANAYFTTLSKIVKSCLDADWTLAKDDDAELEANNDQTDLEVKVEHATAKDVHLSITHTP